MCQGQVQAGLGWAGLGSAGQGCSWGKPGLGPLQVASDLHFGVAVLPTGPASKQRNSFLVVTSSCRAKLPFGSVETESCRCPDSPDKGALPSAWFPALAFMSEVTPNPNSHKDGILQMDKLRPNVGCASSRTQASPSPRHL